METMVNEICSLLRHKYATVYEILGYLKNDPRFAEYSFISCAENLCRNDGCSFSDAWRKAVAADLAMCDIKDKELIASIGSNLGRTDLQGQLDAMEYIKCSLKERSSSAEEMYRSKGRVYGSMGVLTGAFLSVLLM